MPFVKASPSRFATTTPSEFRSAFELEGEEEQDDDMILLPGINSETASEDEDEVNSSPNRRARSRFRRPQNVRVYKEDLMIEPPEVVRGRALSVTSHYMADQTGGKTNWVMGLLFFICGLSTFARSEALLMQTQMFARCFDLGTNFYAISASALFMPGIIVQAIQNRVDPIMDRKLTTRVSVLIRLCVSTLISLGGMVGLLVVSYYYPSYRSNAPFIYSLFALVGICISITFGSFVQIVSLFPAYLQPFYYLGTYSPFFLFAPVNIAIGDLCHRTTTDKPHPTSMDNWEANWDNVLIYYSTSVGVTLLGLVGVLFIVYHPNGKHQFIRKDMELKGAYYGSDTQSLIDTSMATTVKPSNPAHVAPTTWFVLKRIWPFVTASVLVTASSTLVAAVYIDFPITRWGDLPTLLIYDYYMAACLGTLLASWQRFVKLLTPTVLIVLSVIKIVFVPLAVLYAKGDIKQHDDIVAISLNSVNMFLGGLVATASFTCAADSFHRKSARTMSSTVMNVAYYTSLTISMAASFILHRPV